MTTPLEIITQALKKAGVLGVGQTANAEDTNDAFLDLNDMLYQWRRQRWLVYHLIDKSIVSTGAQSYTVGAGGDINTTRPDRLESAFARQITTATPPNQVDYPLRIIQAREDYNLIALKQLTSFPTSIFYDSNYPLGTIYPWPIPQADIYEIHISLKEPLQVFTSLTESVVLPPEYYAALKWNLAARILVSYPGLPDNPELKAMAKGALDVIVGANAQIATLKMPVDLTGRGALYNIYSDTTY